MQRNQIGLQLYTVREETARDMLGTLRRLAEMGYPAVEFAGYGGVPVPEVRAVLDECGMRAIGAHVSLNNWEQRPDETIAELKTLGCSYAVVPYLPAERRQNARQVEGLCGHFNRWAEHCAAEGLNFAYHNHAFEWEPVEGRLLWERLLEGTDPALVGLELDLYWIQYAGYDPLTILREVGRAKLVHVKDMAADESRVDVPVGEGRLPWQQLLPAAREAGVEWYIVEQDNPRSAMDDVRRSLTNLTSMTQQGSLSE